MAHCEGGVTDSTLKMFTLTGKAEFYSTADCKETLGLLPVSCRVRELCIEGVMEAAE